MAQANLTDSPFEGNDANTAGAAILPNGGVDWANLVSSGGTLAIGPDAATGQCDNSFTQGSKEDDTAVVIGQGSIPNSKADLGQFAVGSIVPTSGPRQGHTIMALAWIRNNTSGTTNFDFEINQVAQPDMTFSACPQVDRAITLQRRGDGIANNAIIDDVLISYDVQGGAQNPTFSFRRWTQDSQDPNSPGFFTGHWGNPTMINSANSEGALNRDVAITTAQNGPFTRVPGTTGTTAIPAAQFGEGDIDMTALGIIPDRDDPNAPCVAFGSGYVKSRASSSFTAQMKDYIAPIGLGIDTCGSITIIKQTDPDATAGSFGFTRSGPGTAFDSPFSLSDGQSDVVSNLSPGAYAVAEDDPSPNFALQSIICTTNVGGGTASTVNVATRSVAINLDANEDIVCTFTNALQRGNIVIHKSANPSDGTLFPFTSNYGPAFSLADGGTNDSGPLLPGNTYSVTEGTVPGWEQSAVAFCDNGTPAAIIVLPNTTTNCYFANEADSFIIVEKVIQGPGNGTFDFVSNFMGNFSLAGGANQSSGALDPATDYAVSETVPANWELVSATCDDGSDPSAIDLAAGEIVTCTFTNRALLGSITIHKVSAKGNAPLEGIDFTVNGVTKATDDQGNVCFDGLPFNTYTVTETVPEGYSADPVPDQVVNTISYCNGNVGDGAGVTVEVVNTPLSDIHVQVHSQVPGATASSIECTPDNVPAVPISDEPTYDSLDLEPGTYTCVIVIDP